MSCVMFIVSYILYYQHIWTAACFSFSRRKIIENGIIETFSYFFQCFYAERFTER